MKKDMGSKESVANELFNKFCAKNLTFIVKIGTKLNCRPTSTLDKSDQCSQNLKLLQLFFLQFIEK